MKQIIIGGVVAKDYFIERVRDTAVIWSLKNSTPKKLSVPKSGSANYPKSTFWVEGKRLEANCHRVIAENLVPFKRPSTVSKTDWDKTPQQIKDHIKSLYFVNHKDHNKYNCSISNLEWVTARGNALAYHNHKNSK